MEQRQEAEVLDRLRSGDADVYRQTVSAYGPRLLRLAERLGHTPDEAEDLVQDTFLALVRGADRFEGRAALSSWLTRVLLNRHVDLVRSIALARTRHAPPAGGADGLSGDETERVRLALRRLPEPQQQVLALRFFEELPYEEIARILDAPLGTMHSHAFHGLRGLRALVKEEAP